MRLNDRDSEIKVFDILKSETGGDHAVPGPGCVMAFEHNRPGGICTAS